MRNIYKPEIDNQKLMAEFQAYLTEIQNKNIVVEKINFTKTLAEINKIDETKIVKPRIYFTANSYTKMLGLVQKCDKEIAWKAPVTRIAYKPSESNPEGKGFYYVIGEPVVHPQKVTGTSVDVDEIKLAEWSMNLSDEMFNSIRFQGHSHVNMSVYASAVDNATYSALVDQLEDRDFYIFLIMNKRYEMCIIIYDLVQNVIFENNDIKWDILTSGQNPKSIAEFVEKEMENISFPAAVTTVYSQFGATTYYTEDDEHENEIFLDTHTKSGEKVKRYTDYGWEGFKPKETLSTWHRFETDEQRFSFFMRHPQLIGKNIPSSTKVRQWLKGWLKEADTRSKSARGKSATTFQSVIMDTEIYKIPKE